MRYHAYKLIFSRNWSDFNSNVLFETKTHLICVIHKICRLLSLAICVSFCISLPPSLNPSISFCPRHSVSLCISFYVFFSIPPSSAHSFAFFLSPSVPLFYFCSPSRSISLYISPFRTYTIVLHVLSHLYTKHTDHYNCPYITVDHHSAWHNKQLVINPICLAHAFRDTTSFIVC